MVDKLKMHIWSTTPAISDNTKQLQDKVNELIDEINDLKRALGKPSNEDGKLPIHIVMPSLLEMDFKQMRKIKGLTLREVEKKTGISNAYLSQLETGKIKSPGYNTVTALYNLYCNGA